MRCLKNSGREMLLRVTERLDENWPASVLDVIGEVLRGQAPGGRAFCVIQDVVAPESKRHKRGFEWVWPWMV